MMGFVEFGTPEEVRRRLTSVLESERYLRSVRVWDRKNGRTLHSASYSSSSNILGGSASGGTLNGSTTSGEKGGMMSNTSLDEYNHHSATAPSSKDGHGGGGGKEGGKEGKEGKKSKRFSGFDFYKKKIGPLFSPSSSPPQSSQGVSHPPSAFESGGRHGHGHGSKDSYQGEGGGGRHSHGGGVGGGSSHTLINPSLSSVFG
jgi:serine/threonine protein kinase KIN1/2